MTFNSPHSLYPQAFIESYRSNAINTALLPSANDLVKKETAEYGVGIYTRRPYMRGESIGHFIAEPTHQLRQHSLQRAPGEHLEDAYFVGYLLHSCDPSVVLDMHQQKVFCIKDINVNEPLFMDYASTEDQLFRQFSCACGAPNCRKWITGRNETVNEEGQLYLSTLAGDFLAPHTNDDAFANTHTDQPAIYPVNGLKF